VTDLDANLRRVAAAGTLLVASDFDGTLSPIVNDPLKAEPLERAVPALTALAGLPRTRVSVLSGRSLADLRSRIPLPSTIHLIGGHGTEGPHSPAGLPPASRELLGRIATELAAIAERAPGSTIEVKPGSVAFHYRNADAGTAERERARVLEFAASLDGVRVTEGKMVVELVAAEGNKGTALRQLADSLGADATLYIGDDLTDEDAFRTLRAADLGVKVGDGPTAAACRVPDPATVVALLERLFALRSAPPPATADSGERAARG